MTDLSLEPTQFQFFMLRGLQGKPMYEGTVSAAERGRRRKAGKAARAARRGNR